MKRFAFIISWLILAAAGIASWSVVTGNWAKRPGTSTFLAPDLGSGLPPIVGRESFPIGQPQRIDFDVDDSLLNGLPPREKADQARDWMLWAIASQGVPSAEKLNRALFDVPVVRHGYLRQVEHFEYGRTHSCLLANGEVLALVPKEDPDLQADDLADIADRQRKNLGQIPPAFHVFQYEMDGLKSATLTQLRTIPGAQLFSSDCGYVEANIAKYDDLATFMREMDDLVSVKVVGGGVQLGARKRFAGYRNVSAVEVAAVWQAEADIQNKLQVQQQEIDTFNADWRRQVDAFNARWEGRRDTFSNRTEHDAERSELEQRHKEAMKEFEQKLMVQNKELHLFNGCGFSLDPVYDYAGLAKAIDSFAKAFLGDLLPQERISKIVASLKDSTPDVVPLLKLIDELKSATGQNASDRIDIGELLESVEQSHRFQAARYDGALKGTEVGMILFYTDLIAKLWALNFQNSTPSTIISNFEPMTRVAVSPVYYTELKKLRHTRLWFGAEDTGYEVAQSDQLLFARNATRVYAASSNPLEPGKEVAPNAESEAFLGWWNDHYEEVAAYEQEYRQLNEIMKWSLVVGWLYEGKRGALLNFLQPVHVNHDAWFPDWVNRSPQLRFKQWTKIAFYPPGYLQTQTEAMPLLSSEPYERNGAYRQLSGGVSLASKDLFEDRISLPTELPADLRRSGLNYKLSSSPDELVTLRGSRFKFDSREAKIYPNEHAAAKEGSAVVHMVGPERVKFRGVFGEVGEGQFTRTIRETADATDVRLETAGADLGSLNISRSRNGFRIGWHAREVDDSFALGCRMSRAPDPVALLKSDPAVRFAVHDPKTDDFYIQCVGSKRWLKTSIEKKPLPDVGDGWSARVADLQDGAKIYQLKWLDASQFPDELRTAGEWARGPPPPPPPPPPHVPGGAADFGGIPWNDRDAMARLANDIAQNPAAWKKEQITARKEMLAYLDDLNSRDPRKAADQIREAIDIHGEDPDLLFRKVIAELDSNNDEAASDAANGVLVKSHEAFVGMLDEINARLVAVSDHTRSSLHTCAQAMEWKSSGILQPGDEVRVVPDAGGLSLEAHLANPPVGTIMANPAGFGDAPIYYQDTPSLNAIDWSMPPKAALDYVHSHDLGTVIELPRSDLAHYRPRTISFANEAHPYRAADFSTRSAASAVRTMYHAWPTPGSDDDNKRNKGNEERNDFVYLIVAKSPPAS